MESNTSLFNSEWFQDAAKKGLILGIIHIFVLLILYYAIPNKLASFSYLLFIIVLNLGYAIYSGIQYRKSLGGFIEYGKAFQYATVLLVADGLVGMIFIMIFLLVEPAYPSVMAQSQLDVSLYWPQRFGAPQSALDEVREKFDMEKVEGQHGYAGMPARFGFGLIFYVLGGLISALFIKKRAPETF